MDIATSANRGYNHPYVGKRVRLIHTDDPYTELQPGDEGTVDYVDDIGTIFAKWDKGSGLGMVPGVDRFAIIP